MSETTAAIETPLHASKGEHSTEQTSGEGNGLLIREAPLATHLNLRGNPEDAGFPRAIESVLGLPLPIQACTSSRKGDMALFWLGPDEWLLLAQGSDAGDLEAALREGLPGHVAIVDVSGGQTLVNLGGTGVATVLKKSSPYDFHPSNFGAGRCVQTTFAKATALVASCEDGSVDLVIRRSFADYLARWLLDAGAEFDARII
jgi:sarcosine oxidase subunit gamma